MSKIIKNKRVFYITVLTRKGTVITCQTRLDRVIQSFSDLMIDDLVTLPYRPMGNVKRLEELGKDIDLGQGAQTVTGWVLEAGYVNIEAYIAEADGEQK